MAYDISATLGPRSTDKGVWVRARTRSNTTSPQHKPPVQTPEAAAERKRMEDRLRSYESAQFGNHAERMARGRW